MNKYIAILCFSVGLFVFALAATIAMPTPRLRVTEEAKVCAVYDAPIASFLGTIPPRKGVAHRSVRAAGSVRSSANKNNSAQISAQSSSDDQPKFGQFSTRQAMEYHAGNYDSRVYHQVIGEITVNGYVKK